MADLTLLRKIQKGLISYVLKGELVDEKNSANIGNGAYGTIKKIKYCGTPCAAKEMRSDLLPELLAGMLQKDNSESLIVERFCAEIKILSEIRHPNFVHFIGVYVKEGSSFPILVMELMHTSLAKCLTQYATDRKKFPLANKLFILQDVASALVYLHSQEPPILHRDLTANNVLLTSSMKAKVADLGMAKIMTIGMSKLTQCPGNVVYMPPEALKEHPSYGIEIDVYSYGVLGFHTFSGKSPLHQASGSDSERCFVNLIGEGACLKRTLEKCIDHDPEKRLKASEILTDVETVIEELEIEEGDYLETYYVAQHNTELVKEMSECAAGLSNDLKSKEKYIQKLESGEQNTNVVVERLRCDNEEKESTIKLLESKKVALNQEIETLRTTVEHQEISIEELSSINSTQDQLNSLQGLIDAEREKSQPCQYCSKIEIEKNDLSDLVTSLQAQASNLSSQIKAKNEQLLIKKEEVESKDKKIEQLHEKFSLIDAEIESTKGLSSRYMERGLSTESDSASLTNSMKIEGSKKNVELLEAIKDLKKRLSENDATHKVTQNQYRKGLQDLLIPHKGKPSSCLQCTVLSCKFLGGVNLKPADRISGVIQNIKKAPVSSFEGVMPAVYYDSKIFFLGDVVYKKQKQPCVGAVVWYDPLVGKFDVIRDQEIVCFGHFGTSLLALSKNRRFFLLTDYAWEATSIPSLPATAGDLQNSVLLTYHSILIIVKGKVVWVYADNNYCWMPFELVVEKGDFEISSKNSFTILAGKLFVCISSQKTVYSVELQQLIDITLNYSNSKADGNYLSTQQDDSKSKKENQTFTIEDALNDAVSDETPISDNTASSKQILQMNQIFKGATFIFRHAENLLAFHNTPSSIDRIWYYDVRCYHWHDVAIGSSNNDTTGALLKNWISLHDCAGVLELALPSGWMLTTAWGQAKLPSGWMLTTAWGQAKLYEIQLST